MRAIVPGLRRALRGWLFPALVVFIACVAAWPALSQPGLLNTRGGGDSPFLLQRLHQLVTALSDGHFPARWMPDANYGYGYPFYNFYAPLSIYVAAAFRFLGFSFVRAIHLAQLTGFIVAAFAVFALGRRWLGSPWAGLLAAAAYTFAPFHLVNVYVRGDSLAEFWAMAFYPLVFLAADNLLAATSGRLPVARPLALFALAYAGLILSHNISALIFSPFLLLYLALRLWIPAARRARRQADDHSRDRRASWPFIGFGLLLAFGLAAWFFIPALAEQEMAQLGPVTQGYFHYSNHFRGLDLVQNGLVFDYSPDGGHAFRMGPVQVGLALAGAAVLARAWRRRVLSSEHALFLLLGALLAIFMITPASRLLWDHLPLLPFTQFPWRFLSVASLFLALLSGGLALLPGRAAAPSLAIAAALILGAGGLLGLRTDHLILGDADVTAERLAQYEWFTGNIGTTVSAEYLTPEASPRPWTSAWLNAGDRDRAVALSGAAAAELVERRATRQVWALDFGEPGTVLFPTLYWPGWQATVDGQPAMLRPQPGSGLMALQLPAGDHRVTLELGRTPVRAAAELLSLLAVMVVGVLLVSDARRDDLRFAAPRVAIGVAVLVILGLLWRGENQESSPGDLTWDFAQMGYLHHAPAGVAFERGARLYEYGYSASSVAAGGALTVTFSLAPGDGLPAELALVTPASARPAPDGAADPPLVATATHALDGDLVTFVLSIPPDAPPGLYLPRLTLDGARPLMPSGQTRGDLFLRPVRVSVSAGRPAATRELDVRATSLSMRDATTLDGRFVWVTARALGARYQFSWRAQDSAGATVAQLDSQPGYGFQPSTGWAAGGGTADWLALRLPAEAAEGDYPLVMRLYNAATGEVVLTRRVGALRWDGNAWQPHRLEPSFDLPSDVTPAEVTFAGDGTLIALRGYRLAQRASSLHLTLYWQAPVDIPADYTRFVHVLDAAGAIVAQADGAPAGNSYPTSQWGTGEVVADELAFDLAAVPPGEYILATGFYRPVEGFPRLSASGPDGPLPDGRAVLPDAVTVTP